MTTSRRMLAGDLGRKHLGMTITSAEKVGVHNHSIDSIVIERAVVFVLEFGPDGSFEHEIGFGAGEWIEIE